MTDNGNEYLGVKEAAGFCGLTVSGLRTHIYRIGDLKPSSNFGHYLVFSRANLEAFLQNKRPAWRPGKGTRSRRPTFTPEEWAALCAQFDNRCVCCGSKAPLIPDHIVPRSKGGADTIDNRQPLCKRCNSKKSNHTVNFRLRASAPDLYEACQLALKVLSHNGTSELTQRLETALTKSGYRVTETHDYRNNGKAGTAKPEGAA